ncbi:MAG: hypothetical protein IJ600_07550 [Lachnospiraceae bacterium]|nr:hypothetical protein [Lachnospiraceae bacterium]
MDFVRNLLLRSQNPALQTGKSKNIFVVCYNYKQKRTEINKNRTRNTLIRLQAGKET